MGITKNEGRRTQTTALGTKENDKMMKSAMMKKNVATTMKASANAPRFTFARKVAQNAGFAHNIMFDEDEIPAGANADALSHEDYLNAPGETATSKFDVAGTYSYYCEPHQGAGMQGKVVVK